MHDGSTAEMALAGNDGVIGIALFLGGSTTPHRAVVSIGGDAIKIPARMIQAEFARGGQLQHDPAALYTGAHYPDLANGRL